MRFFIALSFLFLLAAVQATALGYTPDEELLYRLNFGSAEDVRVLLEKGANPNVRSKQGETTLDMAMERNDGETVKMVKILLDKGADVEAKDKSGTTPIVIAVRYKQPEVVKMLLAKSANYHVEAPDGTSLIDFAKRSGDSESVKAIQALLDKEQAYYASLRTPERYKGIVRDYALNNCLYQYWSYVLESKQEPDKEQEIGKKAATAKAAIMKLISEIQVYYPSTSTQSLQDVSSAAVQGVYNSLDSMVSNRNRAEHGVGTEADASERCNKIVSNVQISAPSSVLKSAPSPAPAPGENSPPAGASPPYYSPSPDAPQSGVYR